MSNLAYPYHINEQHRTATTTEEKHIRELMEQVLFTIPGERVNRPSFGSPLLQLLFAPNSDLLAAATQVSVQSALQQWLGELIQVENIEINNEEATLQVLVQYLIRRTQQRQIATFERGIS